MNESNVSIRIHADIRPAMWYLRTLRLFAPVLGYERGMRLAGFAQRLVRVRVGS